MGTSGTQLARIQSRFEEHRLFFRKRVLQRVSIELSPGKTAWLYDLSAGGLSLYGGAAFELGTSTYIRFKFPEANSVIDASGVVAWSDASGRTGVRFTHMQPESNAELHRWLESEPEADRKVAAATTDDAVLASRISSLSQVSDLQAEISSRKLDREAALDLIVRRMLEVTRATGGAIALLEEGDVVCRASVGNAPDVGVRLSPTSLSGECFRTGTVVLLSDSESDPRVDPEICRQLNFRSLLVLPITSDDKCIGIAEVLSPSPRNFEGGDILAVSFLAEMVVSLAQPASPAIESSTADVMSLLSTEPLMTPEAVAAELLLDTSLISEHFGDALNLPPSVSVPILAKEEEAPSAPEIEARAPEVVASAVMHKPVAAMTEPTLAMEPGVEDRTLVVRELAVSAAPAIAKAEASPIVQPAVRTTRIAEAELPALAASPMATGSTSGAEPRFSVVRLAAPQKPTWALALATAIVGVLISAGLLFSYHRRSAALPPNPAVATPAPTAAATSTPPPVVTPFPATSLTTASFKPAAVPGARSTSSTLKQRANEPVGDELLVIHPAGSLRPTPTPDGPPPEAPQIAAANRGLGTLPAGVTTAVPKPTLQISQSQGVIPGKLVRKVAPLYPDLALHAGVSGDVVLLAVIGTDGLLHNIKATSGSPMLREAAMAAARQWRYAPATLSGKPVESDTRITINFHR